VYNGQHHVYFYGGWNGSIQLDDLAILNISGKMSEWRWEQLQLGGHQLAGRCGHTATMVNGSMVVVGGWSNGDFVLDVSVLQVRLPEPTHDCSPYRGLHVRRESGVVVP
jgi:hypothetical protein